MTDTRTPQQRRYIMQSVRGKNTGPELVCRRVLHGMGYRFRLHASDLPGRPDVVFRSRRKAIFVHGCFWHAHGCRKGQAPKSRVEFWSTKLQRNRERDAENLEDLTRLGWKALTVWQCETGDMHALEASLAAFLS